VAQWSHVTAPLLQFTSDRPVICASHKSSLSASSHSSRLPLSVVLRNLASPTAGSQLLDAMADISAKENVDPNSKTSITSSTDGGGQKGNSAPATTTTFLGPKLPAIHISTSSPYVGSSPRKHTFAKGNQASRIRNGEFPGSSINNPPLQPSSCCSKFVQWSLAHCYL
jgi:hypothetical protein